MQIEKKLQEKFTKINKAYFEEDRSTKFLRVEVDLKSLNEIAMLSREISAYLDTVDHDIEEYYLDVFSSGTDQSLDINDLDKHLETNVFVELNEEIKDYKSFEGTLIEVTEDKIVVKWNAKGQFRKQEILKNNIKDIKLYAKTK